MNANNMWHGSDALHSMYGHMECKAYLIHAWMSHALIMTSILPPTWTEWHALWGLLNTHLKTWIYLWHNLRVIIYHIPIYILHDPENSLGLNNFNQILTTCLLLMYINVYLQFVDFDSLHEHLVGSIITAWGWFLLRLHLGGMLSLRCCVPVWKCEQGSGKTIIILLHYWVIFNCALADRLIPKYTVLCISWHYFNRVTCIDDFNQKRCV